MPRGAIISSSPLLLIIVSILSYHRRNDRDIKLRESRVTQCTISFF